GQFLPLPTEVRLFGSLPLMGRVAELGPSGPSGAGVGDLPAAPELHPHPRSLPTRRREAMEQISLFIAWPPNHRAALGLDPRVSIRAHRRNGGSLSGPRVEPEGSRSWWKIQASAIEHTKKGPRIAAGAFRIHSILR